MVWPAGQGPARFPAGPGGLAVAAADGHHDVTNQSFSQVPAVWTPAGGRGEATCCYAGLCVTALGAKQVCYVARGRRRLSIAFGCAVVQH